jgi:hypothetical protein
MRFWIREIIGWLLLLAGMYVFFVCFAMLTNATLARVVEAGPLAFIGFVIFRGGIHLLKVSVAARVCLHAQTIHEQHAGGRPREAGVRDPRTGRYRPPTSRKSA